LFRLIHLFLCFSLILNPALLSAKNNKNQDIKLFKDAQKAQKRQSWKESLNKFQTVIRSFPRSNFAQKSHIEIGKFYKYNRNWQKAIRQYQQAIAIKPKSRDADDAKTAEAAIYYFRQDFPRALGIFQKILADTKDWDQIKYCSYWIKELKRKMSFQGEESFSCGPKALAIALNILGIESNNKNLAGLFKDSKSQVSLSELSKVASQKGLKPKVVKVSKDQIRNLNTPFIALVSPEHYVVVTDTENEPKIEFIDPAKKDLRQSTDLEEFSSTFQGYALIFLKDTQLAKTNYLQPASGELENLKGGICWCCPASSLGVHPNTEYDGNKTCAVGMPSWMVNTVNLNFIIQDIDFSYSSKGMPVEFVRTYNADDPREGLFGRSWTFNYNITLTENPDQSIDIRRGDGRIDHFFWNGTRYQAPEAIYDTLTKNPDNTYCLELKGDKSKQNFNSSGRLVNIKDRNNNTIAFAYDLNGKITTITDPNLKNTIFTYNANNKVSRITLPDSRYVRFVYDANNNLTQSIDMVGATATFTYDAASYITAITTPHQGTTTIEYATTTSEGYYIKSITDALGHKRSYSTYQTHYQVKVTDSRDNYSLYANNYYGYTQSITAPDGNKISFEYDSFGNRTNITDNLGNTTALTYDANGNVTSITDALNNTVNLTYDTDNNLTQAEDPKDNLYIFGYDTNSNLLSIKDPDNQTTSFDYNAFGQLNRITDAKNAITDFTYDAEGNLTKQTNALGKITNYTYDTLGRLLTLTDPKNQLFTYAYDGVDHLIKITYPDTTETNYTYNCCNLIQITDKYGALNFTYDAIGRLKTFTNYDSKVIAYDYDSEDNLTKLTYPDLKAVNYEYDRENRLIKVTDWLNNVTSYGYDSRGNLISSQSPGLFSAYKYDTLSRLTKLINYKSSNMSIASGFEFTLDELSNRTQIKRYIPLVSPFFTSASATYSYNADNQLATSTGKSFTYDDNGNLTLLHPDTGTDTSFTYDYDNQLTQYAQGSTALSYQYDALGNRIKKTQGSTITKYIVDPNRGLPSVLCETNASGAIIAYYVYGLGLISKVIGNNAYYYQYDGIGSTVAITDSNGIIKNKYAYDDFGNIATNSTETLTNPFKYVGKYGVQTDLNDLLYMRARYYIPSIGRFTQYDPIGKINPYIYSDNNPISLIDPSGNQSIVEGGVFLALIIAAFYPIYQASRYNAPKPSDSFDICRIKRSIEQSQKNFRPKPPNKPWIPPIINPEEAKTKIGQILEAVAKLITQTADFVKSVSTPYNPNK
jgi:RHS repeat-associated protein